MWKRKFVIIPNFVVLICVIVGILFIFSTASALPGGQSANVFISVTPEYGPGVPSNFTATFITRQQVYLNWEKGANTTQTLIRAKFYEYPKNKDDGYLVYYGTGESANDTALDLDITFGPIFYRAWSEHEVEGWSVNYAEASTENPELEGIVDKLTDFNFWVSNLYIVFQGLLLIVPLLLLSGLAFWKPNPLLFMLAAGAAMMTGLYCPDIISGNYSTTPLSLTIGMMLMAYSLVCFGFAYKTLFGRETGDED